MKIVWSLVFFYTIFVAQLVQAASQDSLTRPKIGLVLSGGGAKGLAHVGVLKMLDSAGLKVDYIVGSSMGAIVGALYAVGYSGKAIEHLGQTLDWANLFASTPLLSNVSYEEKAELEKYMIELPINNWRPNFPSGFFEGEDLSLSLSTLLAPVYGIKDFTKFNIPFKAIATDAGTGQPVALTEGDIVKALRASIAIPGVFTAVDYRGGKLIDGGVVRNFPVKDALEMGANYVIGSNVAGGLKPAEKLHTPIDFLTQIGSYKDAEDFKEERQLCNLYIKHNTKPFNTGSFYKEAIDSIMILGEKTALRFYPTFKRLADSLKTLDATYNLPADRLPLVDKIKIDQITIRGLTKTAPSFFVKRLKLQIDKAYAPEKIHLAMKSVYGTRFYKRIHYRYNTDYPNHTVLDIHAIENDRLFIKGGLHFNSFSNGAAILNVTVRNFLLTNSRTLLTFNAAKDPKVRFDIFKYIGKNRLAGLQISFLHAVTNDFTAQIDLPSEEAFTKEEVRYKDQFTSIGLRFFSAPYTYLTWGIGIALEYIKYSPPNSNAITVTGNNLQDNIYFFWGINTINRALFPTKGFLFEAKLGAKTVFQTASSTGMYVNGLYTELIKNSAHSYNASFAYIQGKLAYYQPLFRKLTFLARAGLHVNFSEENTNILFNSFRVGGLNEVLRNQITLMGFTEGAISSLAVFVGSAGFQYEPKRNVFISPILSLINYDIHYTNLLQADQYKINFGYGISVGYKSPIGPFSVSYMGNTYTNKKTSFYLNFGVAF